MSKDNWNPIIEAQDDGLPAPEVGSWALQKYKLFGHYCQIFTRSMHAQWPNLIYLDLFAGSGYSRIRNTNQIIYGSPLISL